MADPLDHAEGLAFARGLFDRLKRRWAHHGGRAANEYRATLRFTTDYDFWVSSLEGLGEELEKLGFEIIVERQSTDDSTRLGQIIAQRGHEAYDFNLADYPPYHDPMYDRADPNEGVIAVEDVLIQKLDAWRDKDRSDVRSVLETGIAFDEALVRFWGSAERFGFNDKFDRELLFREFCIEANERSRKRDDVPLLEDQIVRLIYTTERKDAHHVDELLAGAKTFDVEYVREWCARFEVQGELEHHLEKWRGTRTPKNEANTPIADAASKPAE